MLLPSPTSMRKNTLTIHNPINLPTDHNPSAIIDETPVAIHHNTWAQGKAPRNDKTPSSPSNVPLYQNPCLFLL